MMELSDPQSPPPPCPPPPNTPPPAQPAEADIEVPSVHLGSVSSPRNEGVEDSPAKRPRLLAQPRILIPDPPVYFIPTSAKARDPIKNYSGDAGFDLFTTEACEIAACDRMLISTGIYVMIPKGFAGMIMPKSGVTMDTGLFVVPGVIDSGYRDVLHVMVYNSNRKTKLYLPKHSNIAQMVIHRIHSSDTLLFTDRLTSTKRSLESHPHGHPHGRVSL